MIYTIKEIADLCNLNTSVLRMYLSHYTLTKYLKYIKKNYKKSLTVEIDNNFIADFIKYLNKKTRTFDIGQVNLIKTKLERLLNEQTRIESTATNIFTNKTNCTKIIS